MFRVKICGVTSVEAAQMVAAAGADAVGLNFYPKSLRCIEAELARAIVTSLPGDVTKVGLFVNAPIETVCDAYDRLPLDLIQLHGDEPPEFVAQLAPRPVLRAFRLAAADLPKVFVYIEECRRLGHAPAMVLIDAFKTGEYGGTGKVADWSAAAEYAARNDSPPLVLAGGLTADNVGQAISVVRPEAVDTASGVEDAPGRKDRVLVERFVRAAREAFELGE